MRLSARADTHTNLIMLFGGILAVLICVIWYAKNIYPSHVAIDYIDSDLSNIQGYVNTACQSIEYYHLYNPRTEEGTLTTNGSLICIQTTYLSRCRQSFCSLNENKTLDLKNLTDILITRNETHATGIY